VNISHECSASEPAQESCNGVDDDCDGLIDEDDAVDAPCPGVPNHGVGPGTGIPFDPSPENSHSVGLDDDGNLVLTVTEVNGSYIWVANSGENTASKLETETGCEVARYHVGADPSRTAVDLQGNGIIACRGDHRVLKIAVVPELCVDKNEDGAIQTSYDMNNNCIIEPDEMVADDECILWDVKPDGEGDGNGTARAAGVDKENHIWIGFWNSMKLRRLNPNNGEVVATHSLSGRPYGLAIDADGILWVASRDPSPHRLYKVHPEEGVMNSWASPASTMYGLGIDGAGKIWIATGEAGGLARFDPLLEEFTHSWSWPQHGNTRGVVAKVYQGADGSYIGSRVFVAHNTWTCVSAESSRTVSVVDTNTLTVQPAIDLGMSRGPVGVALDRQGYLWTVNQCEGGDAANLPGSVSKIDAETGLMIGTYPVGTAPYTYSDMTGYVLGNITAPQGYYRKIFESQEPRSFFWSMIQVEAEFDPEGETSIEIRVRTGNSMEEISGASWSGPFGPYPPATFPLDLESEMLQGLFLEVEIQLHTTNSSKTPVVKSILVDTQLL
jgi:DNA-binding beta-propeller fold protein YncE